MIVMAEQIWRRDQWGYQTAVILGVTLLLAAGGASESAWRLPWAAGRHAFELRAQPAVLEGVIVDLVMEGTETLQMTTLDGRDWQLSFSPETTAVFVPGAVLNPSHLRPGQHVQVMASFQGPRGVARAIRILKSP